MEYTLNIIRGNSHTRSVLWGDRELTEKQTKIEANHRANAEKEKKSYLFHCQDSLHALRLITKQMIEKE